MFNSQNKKALLCLNLFILLTYGLPLNSGGHSGLDVYAQEKQERPPESLTDTLKGVVPPGAHTPETLEIYQRKHVSFYQEQADHPLNTMMYAQFNQEMKRFDYHLLASTLDMPILDFLSTVKKYQSDQAAYLAEKGQSKTINNLKFGQTAVTLSETQHIIASAFIFSSKWDFSKIYLTGPDSREIRADEDGNFPGAEALPEDTFTERIYRSEQRYDAKTKKKFKVQIAYLVYYTISEHSDLALALNIFNLAENSTRSSGLLKDVWTLSRSNDYHIVRHHDIALTNQILSAQNLDPVEFVRHYDKKTGEFSYYSLENESYIKSSPRFSRLETQDPYVEFMSLAQARMATADSWKNIWIQMKQMDPFQLKGVIEQNLPEKRWAEMHFGIRETSDSLHVRLRDAYKIFEYTRNAQGETKKVEIGFSRVRGFTEKTQFIQPLSGGRPLEVGDMAQEYAMYGGSLTTGLQGYFNFENAQTPLTGGLHITAEWFPHNMDAKTYLQHIRSKQQDPRTYALTGSEAWYDEFSWIAGGLLGTQFDGFGGLLYKQFYGPLAWTFGGSLHLFTDNLQTGSVGVMPRTGLMYYLSPHASLELSTGLRFAYPWAIQPMLQLGTQLQW
jgi:hypothetical protein